MAFDSSAESSDISGVLSGVRVPSSELQSPSPVHESLEWQLAGAYWQEAGSGCRTRPGVAPNRRVLPEPGAGGIGGDALAWPLRCGR